MRGGSDICVDHCVPEIARYVSLGKAQARGHWCSHEDRSTSRLQFRCIESCVKFARCASRQARRSWVLAGRRLGNCARGEKKAVKRCTATGAPGPLRHAVRNAEPEVAAAQKYIGFIQMLRHSSHRKRLQSLRYC